MKEEIKEIVKYVENKISKACEESSLELYEVILLPEIPFYIIARLNAFRISSLSNQKLDKLETKLQMFQEVGIRCVVRPKNFKIYKNILNRKILERATLCKKYKITRLTHCPIFKNEIKTLSKEIRDYLGFKKDVFFWEIKVNPQKIFPITAAFFSKRKIIPVKKNTLVKIEVLPYSNLKIVKALLDLTHIAALKKKSLLRFLLKNEIRRSKK